MEEIIVCDTCSIQNCNMRKYDMVTKCSVREKAVNHTLDVFYKK